MGGSDERKYEEAFWALALLLLAFHLVYIGITPYDLAPDEAYYWLWSKRLSWGYYSKPPLVAWLIRLSTSLGGDTPFFVRLGAPIFSFISSLALFYFAKGLFGPRVGFWAFLLSNLTAASPVGAMIMTIDAPLIAFWGLTLLFLLPALRGKGAFWYLSGICLGLGLLSKYAAGALVPSLFFYLATSKKGRGWLRRREPYLWAGLGFLLLLPNLIWNHLHGWITFQHTSSLVERRSFNPVTFFEFIGTQFGLMTPLIFLLIAYGIIQGVRKGIKGGDDRYLLPFWGTAPLLGFFILLSFFSPCYANWAAPSYLTGFVLAAASVIEAPWTERRKRGWLLSAAILGGVICFFVYNMDLLRRFPVPQEELPSSRLMGWRKLGEEVGRIIEAEGGELFVITQDRRFSSELAFYTPGHPRAYLLNLFPYPISQFDLWGGLEREKGKDAVFVTKQGRGPPSLLLRSFEACHRKGDVEIRYRGKFIKGYSLYLCRRFKGLPHR